MAFAVDHRRKALIVSAYGASLERLALITRGGRTPRTSRHRSQIAKEKVMSGRIAALVLVGLLVGVGAARAQEATPGPERSKSHTSRPAARTSPPKGTRRV